MDFRNTFSYHLIVALISLILVLILFSFEITLARATAAVAFFLLFLTLIIGPVMRIWRPNLKALPLDLPWSWRGELGIWFTIVSLIHITIVFSGKQWDVVGYMVGMRLADLVALVAIFLAVVLAITSFGKVIKFLGIASWKWLHSFSYVIFYLISAHVINHAFLRAGRPADWLHWSYLVMILIVIALQIGAFVKTVVNYRKTLKDEDGKSLS